MDKHDFSQCEKYAIWLHHEKRCWLCLEPLRLHDTTIDHVIPETLSGNPSILATVITEYGLPAGFKVNGFENWLPCHNRCNASKGSAAFGFTPGFKVILDRLVRDASSVERTATTIKQNIARDKLFGIIAIALESDVLSPEDINDFLSRITGAPAESFNVAKAHPEMIRLDNGYWLHREDVAVEGPCLCGQEACVEAIGTVYCYWAHSLSDWVVRKRLHWKCYDESIMCPRCADTHKRGHIGRGGVCGRPYLDQSAQTD